MRRTSWAILFLVCAAAFVTFAAVPLPPGTGYHLLKKVTLGGEGGWDYLSADPVSHRVFLSRGTHIMVVEADGKVVGDIPNLKGTHGAEIVNEFGRGFSSNGGSNSVTIFDLKTLATISEVNLPADLDASWMVKAAINRTVNIAPTPRRKRDTNFEVEGSAAVGATSSAPISGLEIWTSGGLLAVAAGAG